MRLARERFEVAMTRLPSEEDFVHLLGDPIPAPDEHLPATGVSPDWERWLSPAFIRAPGYGTRCTTLLSVRSDGSTRLRELTWQDDGRISSEVIHRFTISRKTVC